MLVHPYIELQVPLLHPKHLRAINQPPRGLIVDQKAFLHDFDIVLPTYFRKIHPQCPVLPVKLLLFGSHVHFFLLLLLLKPFKSLFLIGLLFGQPCLFLLFVIFSFQVLELDVDAYQLDLVYYSLIWTDLIVLMAFRPKCVVWRAYQIDHIPNAQPKQALVQAGEILLLPNDKFERFTFVE